MNEIPFNKSDNGTVEVSRLATWTAGKEYWQIHQALLLAKRKILKIIDPKTYKIATDHYFSDNYKYVVPDPAPVEPPTPEELAAYALLDQLVEKIQVVLVNFAFAKNINKDTVIWDNTGIKVVWNNDMRPAQKETLEEIEDDLEAHAYEFLDLLIEFLNQNRETFTDFQASLENLKLRELFINDATDFSYYYNIEESTCYFFEILDSLRRVQRDNIYAALTPQYYFRILDYQKKRLTVEAVTTIVATFEELLAIENPTANQVALVTDEKKYYIYTEGWIIYCYDVTELLAYVKPALVYLSIYNKIMSETKEYKRYTPKALDMLKDNAAHLRTSGEAELSKIVKYVESQTKTFVDPTTQVDKYIQPIVTKNTFSI